MHLENDHAGMLLLEQPRLPPLVPGLMPAGASMLAGAPKTGKTMVAVQLMYALATGTQFLGKRLEQRPVIFLAMDTSPDQVVSRLRRLVVESGPEPLPLPSLEFLGVFGQPMDEYLEHGWLEFFIQSKTDATRPLHRLLNMPRPVIIVDTLGMMVDGEPAQTDGKARDAYQVGVRFMKKLPQLKEIVPDWVLLHHTRKSDGGRDSDPFDKVSGSNAYRGGVDATVMLEPTKNGDDWLLVQESREMEPVRPALMGKADGFVYPVGKTLEAARDAFQMQSTLGSAPGARKVGRPASPERLALERFLSGKEYTKAQIREQFPQVDATTLHNRLKRMREAGLVLYDQAAGVWRSTDGVAF